MQDTNRGAGNQIASQTTNAQVNSPTTITSFNSNGYTIGTAAGFNNTSDNFVSWTFRKQPKFFDVVTYTGTGANRTIAHALGSVPGCIIVKRTDTAGNWQVYHNGLTSAAYGIQLNLTNAQASDTTLWNSTAPTSAVFSVGTSTDVNASGGTYVAYIYAHNAGGFGLTGTDNVISCGSFTGNTTVNLGYEPQWVLVKNYAGADSWTIMDNMRGMANPGNDNALLRPNTSGAEGVGQGIFPTATGFTTTAYSGLDCIYIAIRRGPMKVPTDGTTVYSGIARNGNGTTTVLTGVGFPPDAVLYDRRGGLSAVARINDKLRGAALYLTTTAIDAEVLATQTISAFGQDGVTLGNGSTSTYPNSSGESYINWFFKRAPSFFDEVCYTGTSSATTQTHNLSVVPELIIVKRRDGASGFYWGVYAAPLGATKYLALNATIAAATSAGLWNNTTPTSSVFSLGTNNDVNLSAATYVAYLFATCAGVSKVGTYTGNGTTQTINCGFAAGARFVLIKRTDSTGDWYVYDTARGMTVSTDPYLLLNSTAAETATLGSVTTVTTGFAVNAAVLAAINTNGASYIYLSIA